MLVVKSNEILKQIFLKKFFPAYLVKCNGVIGLLAEVGFKMCCVDSSLIPKYRNLMSLHKRPLVTPCACSAHCPP